MKRTLIVAAVSALVIGVCVVAVSDRGRGKVVIDFVSVTKELGFDVITFTISNRASVPVSGVYGVQWGTSNAWVNLPTDTFMQRYQLAAGESSTIDVPWREDLYWWRLHASVRPGWSALDQWNLAWPVDFVEVRV